MKATALGAVVLLSAILSGCADPTGEIDAEGHNGYDLSTCTDSKALALDMMYGELTPTQGKTRLSKVSTEAAKASDQDIKQAAQQLVASYESGNQTAVNTAITSLVKACQL